jgi:glutamyl-tRNA reductase
MIDFNLIGLNQQTCNLAVREKIAVRTDRLSARLRLLGKISPDGIILSTCNRTEVYSADEQTEQTYRRLINYVKHETGLSESEIRRSLYSLSGTEAAAHLFKVAAGLDSMVVGEYEVLGQIGQALEAAEKAGMVNPLLRRIFQLAIHTGRRVRCETGISRNALSVSSVAVAMTTRFINNFKSSSLLVIGTGEAGRLAARVARERGVQRIAIVGRHPHKVAALAEEFEAVAVDSRKVVTELFYSDIVITCSGAPHWALDIPRVQSVMSRRPDRPLFIIDIAVPRNVDPAVGTLAGVTLYNIDDLTEISQQNRQSRAAEIHLVEAIIQEEMAELDKWWKGYLAAPLIKDLTARAESIRADIWSRTSKKLSGTAVSDVQQLELMSHAIVNKLLHAPIQYLKSSPDNAQLAILKEVFGLNDAAEFDNRHPFQPSGSDTDGDGR